MEYLSISIHKIKRGDLFWESEGGQDAAFVAITDAKRERNGYAVEGIDILTGKPQRFYEADRGGAYGPRLYNQPQYTRPDYPALMSAMAVRMRERLDEGEAQAKARESGLQLAATQYSKSRDEWMTKAKATDQEIARLHFIIDSIGDIATQHLNGITMSQRIQERIKAAKENA